MPSWYPRYPGDYTRDTGDLTLVEHGAYTVLLDTYYSTETPLTTDRARLYRMARAYTDEERNAVESVLDRFFVEIDGCLHNLRADREIEKVQQKHEHAKERGKRAAKARWNGGKKEKKKDATPPELAGWTVSVTENSTLAELVENLLQAFPATNEQGWSNVLTMTGDQRLRARTVRDWLIDCAGSTTPVQAPVPMLRGRMRKEMDRAKRTGSSTFQPSI